MSGEASPNDLARARRLLLRSGFAVPDIPSPEVELRVHEWAEDVRVHMEGHLWMGVNPEDYTVLVSPFVWQCRSYCVAVEMRTAPSWYFGEQVWLDVREQHGDILWPDAATLGRCWGHAIVYTMLDSLMGVKTDRGLMRWAPGESPNTLIDHPAPFDAHSRCAPTPPECPGCRKK